MKLRFWGVRGSIATPALENLAFGGNTTCLEVITIHGRSVIFDAGTGLAALGAELGSRSAPPGEYHILFTHFHWDHIQGFPFFDPLYVPGVTIHLYSVHPERVLKEAISSQMRPPYFPVDFGLVEAKIEFHQLDSEKHPLRFDEVSIHPFQLNHPQGSTGFRLECSGGALVLATDHETGNRDIDSALVDRSQNATVLIADTHFTPQEIGSFRGWGHSTWLDAARLCKQCRIERLFLFHHNPSHSDRKLLEILDLARGEFENTSVAREGRYFSFR